MKLLAQEKEHVSCRLQSWKVDAAESPVIPRKILLRCHSCVRRLGCRKCGPELCRAVTVALVSLKNIQQTLNL